MTPDVSGIDDVLIIGAGISGIGMAAHLVARCPHKSFTILERRANLGGTWDLFRYPGVRSDSDMHTLGFAFAPWRDEQSIAPGATIRAYLQSVADSRDITRRIHFDSEVARADWDSAATLWTLTLADGTTRQARFLFMASGYYDYDNPHDAQIPGLANFAGDTIHPQFWPEGTQVSGKRIIVIGSGATAVTMVPALAAAGAEVTMLQRSPGWMFTRPSKDRLANWLLRLLPARAASALIRKFNAGMQGWLYRRCKANPGKMAAFFTGDLRRQLGDAYDAEALTPTYNPWDQRLCVVPDGDLFAAVKAGAARIITGTIARVEAGGVQLSDGRHIAADMLVPATGLRVALMGKVAVSVDGVAVDFARAYWYRSCMFSNVPNFAASFGYLNAGWTLRVDMVADWLCRLFAHMDAWGRPVVTPFLAANAALVEDDPIAAYSSGYLQRAQGAMPRSAAADPWRIGTDYRVDRPAMAQTPIDDGVLRFARPSSFDGLRMSSG